MLNLANKFSQCTFSVAEHYDLFSGLIILRQASWRRSYDDIPLQLHRTDRETAAGKAQRYHTDLKLIYMLSIMPYATSRQFRVDGHFKSVRNNWRHLYKTPTYKRPQKPFSEHATHLASFSMTYLATLLKLAKFSISERTAGQVHTGLLKNLWACWWEIFKDRTCPTCHSTNSVKELKEYIAWIVY